MPRCTSGQRDGPCRGISVLKRVQSATTRPRPETRSPRSQSFVRRDCAGDSRDGA
jgi:hypothetical protein